jgi:hypothetical protein
MTADYEAEIEEQLETIRAKFVSTTLTSQREVVESLGKTLEKIRKDEKARSGICEEIKHRLREEIERGLISEKSIENHCPAKWKNPQKSKAGKKGAEKSAEIFSAEPMLVASNGSVETVPPAYDRDIRQRLDSGEITTEDAEHIVRAIKKVEAETDKPISQEKKEEVIQYFIGTNEQIEAIKSHGEVVAESILKHEVDEQMEARRAEAGRISALADDFDDMRSVLKKLAICFDIHFLGTADNPEEIARRQKRYMEIFAHVGAEGDETMRKNFQELEEFSKDNALINRETEMIQRIIDAEIKNRRTIDDEKLR